ncbi:hypothetical protein Misp01_01480 [Microtetraspora sp. NBRC 13810]|uniref:YbaB/EbfC family nucleoid-associated protein n=1 Tax=Microtetraspora sp. NBRC 13810 TaxID=3030990 RepID=UPI0024A3A920|nr:YbaB/EbfC family nucleoid-associated protein [Microtetraspora sp. NBRC 13810]GLW05018.1 hypothetical protein Misp01_01480 [Microtetraspora sp. NBRC 13810]
MNHTDAFNEGREGDAEGLLREADAWMGAYTETLRELSTEEFTGSDASGRVTARVTGAGRLLGVAIDPRAMRDLDHTAVAAAAVEAVGAARAAMGERLAEAMEEMIDPRSRVDAGHDPLAPYIEAMLRGE